MIHKGTKVLEKKQINSERKTAALKKWSFLSWKLLRSKEWCTSTEESQITNERAQNHPEYITIVHTTIPSKATSNFVAISNQIWALSLGIAEKNGTKYSIMNQVILWKTAIKKFEVMVCLISRPYPLKCFKGCLSQFLLAPFLNSLSQII